MVSEKKTEWFLLTIEVLEMFFSQTFLISNDRMLGNERKKK